MYGNDEEYGLYNMRKLTKNIVKLLCVIMVVFCAMGVIDIVSYMSILRCDDSNTTSCYHLDQSIIFVIIANFTVFILPFTLIFGKGGSVSRNVETCLKDLLIQRLGTSKCFTIYGCLCLILYFSSHIWISIPVFVGCIPDVFDAPVKIFSYAEVVMFGIVILFIIIMVLVHEHKQRKHNLFMKAIKNTVDDSALV